MLTGNQQFSSLGGTVLTKVLPVKKNAFFLVTSKYATFWLPQHMVIIKIAGQGV